MITFNPANHHLQPRFEMRDLDIWSRIKKRNIKIRYGTLAQELRYYYVLYVCVITALSKRRIVIPLNLFAAYRKGNGRKVPCTWTASKLQYTLFYLLTLFNVQSILKRPVLMRLENKCNDFAYGGYWIAEYHGSCRQCWFLFLFQWSPRKASSLNCAFSVVSDGFLPDTFQNPPLQYYHFQNRGQLKYTESAQNWCVYISRFAFKRTFCACYVLDDLNFMA